MPKTRAEIKASRPIKSWVSPHFGDGGWHATPGCEDIDPLAIVPMFDHVLLEILPQPLPYASIIRPENVELDRDSRLGRVLKIGTGSRIIGNGEERSCCCLRPGDEVVIGPHSDWESQDGRYVICQEDDARVILKRGSAAA